MAKMESVVRFKAKNPCKLVKWKIHDGSRLSLGTVLFLYEYPQSEEIKDKPQQSLKFKSDVEGTVKCLLATEGSTLNLGCELLELQACTHQVVMKDLCAECGTDLRRLDSDNLAKVAAVTSVSMIHSVPELRVSHEQAQLLGQADEETLLRNRKLVLLVDLDQTLIHTTNENVPPNMKDVHHFQLYGPNSPWYHTKFRPGTQDFLESISKLYELHICTFGARAYAHHIASLLDQGCKYFSHRILSRDESFNTTSKTGNLKALFPRGDSLVCIIDDREDVWNFSPNLVPVKPYIFFSQTGDINAPPFSNQTENVNPQAPPGSEDAVDDNDDYLFYLEEILSMIHKAFYDMYDQMKAQKRDEIPDLKTVIPYVQRKVLKGANVVFSGLIPTNADVEKSKLWMLAKSLGANVTKDLCTTLGQSTTHVVTSKLGTAKVNQAKRMKGVHIVNPEWLGSCAERWEHVDERLFALKEGVVYKKHSHKNLLFEMQKNIHPNMAVHRLNSEATQNIPCAVYHPVTGKLIRQPVNSQKASGKDVAKEEKFADSISPLLSFSTFEIEQMGREVADACSEGSDNDDSSDSEGNKKKINNSESSSCESLSGGNCPKGWKKRKRQDGTTEKDDDDAKEEFGGVIFCEDDEPDTKSTRREFPSDAENSVKSNSEDGESVGSVDEEMAAACEREFLNCSC